MKQFAGTPGEWCAWIDGNDRWHVIGPATEAIASGYHPAWNVGSMEANIRLMAASKALLEALQAYMEADESDMSCREWIDIRDRARAAIAKALGE